MRIRRRAILGEPHLGRSWLGFGAGSAAGDRLARPCWLDRRSRWWLSGGVDGRASVPEERDPRELIDALGGDRGRGSDANLDDCEGIDLVYERRGVGAPLLLLHGLGSR